MQEHLVLSLTALWVVRGLSQISGFNISRNYHLHNESRI